MIAATSRSNGWLQSLIRDAADTPGFDWIWESPRDLRSTQSHLAMPCLVLSRPAHSDLAVALEALAPRSNVVVAGMVKLRRKCDDDVLISLGGLQTQHEMRIWCCMFLYRAVLQLDEEVRWLAASSCGEREKEREIKREQMERLSRPIGASESMDPGN